MHITDFDIYKDLLKQRSGLVLTQDKSYLLDSRLNPVAKKWGYGNIEALTAALRGVPPKDLINDIVEAMTTNETSFFRDIRPFDTLKDHVLNYFRKAPTRAKNLKIWCAASSSGQEPYSIAMLLNEEKSKMPDWKFDITATDISYEILDTAKEGAYTQFEVQRGLPIQLLMKYFTQNGDKWHINTDVKNMVKFKYFNLLENMAPLGQFDIIFCRNVLIYFDQPTKKDVLERMAKLMPKDGFLFLGGAETVLNITDSFKAIPGVRGLYGLTDGPHLSTAPLQEKQALA